MTKMKQRYILLLLWLTGSLLSCNKKAFLDKIPNTSLVIPQTLADLQALMDEDSRMNVSPYMPLLTAEEYYMETAFYNSLMPVYRNCYTWKKDIYEGKRGILDWNTPYTQVFYANVVLEKLNGITITGSNEREWKRVKGCALFFKANAFYNLLTTFSMPYDAATSAKDPGIVLRFSSDMNEKYSRSSVQQGYTQLLTDLEEAASLLQTTVDATARNRPSKPAAFALLARINLSMRRYEQAFHYADECLKIYKELFDYNGAATGVFPFALLNPEVIWQGKTVTNEFNILSAVSSPSVVIEPALINLYSSGDLRRTYYYRTGGLGFININGSYNRSTLPFTGLAVDEVYLVRAETYARAGKKEEALADLNTLLQKRFSNATTYVPVTASSADEALGIILRERRKELVFRGLRFTDVRRLNKEGHAITLTRTVDGTTYTLPPNDPRYALPVPLEEVMLNGVTQNER